MNVPIYFIQCLDIIKAFNVVGNALLQALRYYFLTTGYIIKRNKIPSQGFPNIITVR